MTRLLVSIVAPLFNEAPTLPQFLSRLVEATDSLGLKYTFEFILVDDGSTDGSLALGKNWITREPRLRVIELRRNFGQTAALQAGFAAAKGELIISMDSDLQHFPEDLHLFLEGIEQGFDLVCGWRYAREEGVLRRWPSLAANRLIRAVSGLTIHDVGTTFRAYRADLIAQLHLLGEQHRFVPVLASLVGAKVTEVRIQNVERRSGESHYGIGRTVNVLLDIIYLYFSQYYFAQPLKAFGKIGLALGSTGLAISAWLLAYSWITRIPTIHERGGWFLLSSLLMLGGLQTLLTGIVAEVMVRIYYRSGQIEQGFVRREWNRESIGVSVGH